MNERDRMLAEGPRVAPEPQSADASSSGAEGRVRDPSWRRWYESWRPQILSFGPAFVQIVLWPSAPEWVTWSLVLLGFLHVVVVRRLLRRRPAH
jgi:hypothetical protein